MNSFTTTLAYQAFLSKRGGIGRNCRERPDTNVLIGLYQTSNIWMLSLLTGILVPRAHDPSGLWQGSRALAGPDFLSMHRAFVSYSRPIRFDEKSVNHGLSVLDQARALDPCRRPEGSWALGTRMTNRPLARKRKNLVSVKQNDEGSDQGGMGEPVDFVLYVAVTNQLMR